MFGSIPGRVISCYIVRLGSGLLPSEAFRFLPQKAGLLALLPWRILASRASFLTVSS
jgi:hypothetical protein